MAESVEELHPLAAIADEFVARLREGETPEIDEFCSRHPEQAAEIRDFLAAVLLLEEARPMSTPGDRAVASAMHAPESPTRKIGEYRLLREIGRGGMGIVYEAKQESLGRRVALKVLPAWAVARPQFTERFYREARAAAGLHHTNIVPVFAVGDDNGQPYYVMPFIDGLGLDAVLAQMRSALPNEQHGLLTVAGRSCLTHHEDESNHDGMPSESGLASTVTLTPNGQSYWQAVARIGLGVAEALDYAADQGVLHRDIKPANLLLDVHGVVWVTDFGLAKSAGDDDLTVAGDVLGTLRYLAPERLSGVCDLRGDIYSLGATLYELATLQPPMSATDRSQLTQQILHEEPAPPRGICRNMPRDLETIILKAMAKHPRDRYLTAAALADDLRLFLEDRPIQARRIAAHERLWRWCRRNPLLATMEAAVAALCLSAVVILAVANARIRSETVEKSAALTAKDTAIGEKDGALAQARASESFAQRRFHATQMSLGEVALRENEWSRVLDYLNTQTPSAGQPDLRGFGWHYLNRQIHRGLHKSFVQEPGEIWALAFSPDGKLLAVSSGHDAKGGTVALWSVASGERIRTLIRGADFVPSSVAFSPDGEQVLAGLSNNQVIIWNAATGEPAQQLVAPAVVRSADWSPDGRYVAAGCENGAVLVWDTKEWKARNSLRQHGGPVLGLVFSRDGQRLFTSASWGSENRMARVHDMSGGEPKTIRDLPNQFICDATADGKEIATLSWADVRLVEWESGTERSAHTIGPGNVGTVRLSRDGSRYATAGRDDRMAILWDRSSQRSVVQGPHAHSVISVAIDPNSRYWATGSSDGEVKIWHYDVPEDVITLMHEPPNAHVLASASNTLILGGDFPAEGREIATGKVVGAPPVRHARRISDDATIIVGAHIAANDTTETLQIWRRADAKLLHEFRLPDQWAIAENSLAISRTGRWLATRTWGGPIRLWDLAGEQSREVRQFNPADCMDLAFSPDESLIVAGCQFGRVRMWEVATGKPLPDLWPYESGLIWCQRVAFSLDGKRLAAGNNVGVVRVWDVASRKLISTLSGHLGQTTDLQFLHDGKTLAVAGVGPIRLWDVEIGQECLALANSDYKIFELALSSDGQTLISRSDHGVVRLWKSGQRKRD